MSESERRRKYRHNRVLIETARILDPQFADAVVYLTGAQIEMLRNVTPYLNRLDTYVTVYNVGYYLTPTIEEYDAILAIVSDLEESLMGNPNVIWGYNDIWANTWAEAKSGDGTFEGWSAAVPAGEVWVLQIASIANKTAARGTARIELQSDAEGQIWLFSEPSPGLTAQVCKGPITLIENDRIKFIQELCLDGDNIQFGLSGYKMVIP
jgi:hypothetical protein